MTIVGIAMVRDEADIIAASVGHMLTQVDRVIVADNLSVDGTRETLDAMAADDDRLLVTLDEDPAYEQSRKMSALAALANERFGATWVVPFDADELWYPTHARTIGDALRGTRADVVNAALFDYVTSDFDDAAIVDPTKRIQWRRRDPAPLPKVAARWYRNMVIEQGNHGVGNGGRRRDGLLRIAHYPWRSPEQFTRKVRQGAAALALTDLPESSGAHWRQYAAILEASGEAVLIDEVYRRWFHVTDPDLAGLVLA